MSCLAKTNHNKYLNFCCVLSFPFNPDPNTQILYACDSCGEKFLDASSLAQHVRIHTAQALVMFQADSDFYQQYATGDTAWQTTEQVIQGGELLFRTRDGEEEVEADADAEAGTEGETVVLEAGLPSTEIKEETVTEVEGGAEVVEMNCDSQT